MHISTNSSLFGSTILNNVNLAMSNPCGTAQYHIKWLVQMNCMVSIDHHSLHFTFWLQLLCPVLWIINHSSFSPSCLAHQCFVFIFETYLSQWLNCLIFGAGFQIYHLKLPSLCFQSIHQNPNHDLTLWNIILVLCYL